MAITNAIPQLWSARILDGFQRVNVWSNLVTDVSAELPEGDSLHLNSVTSGVTVKDYSKNTDIEDPEVITDSDLILTVDQLKYFNINVDDVDKVQAKPDMLSYFALQASRQVSATVDNYLYGIWKTGISAGQKTTTPAIPDNLVMTDTALQEFVTSINAVVQKLQTSNWPLDMSYMVLNTKAAWAIREYLTRKGVGTGAASDQAFIQGKVSDMFGINTMVDANLSNIVTDGTPIVNFGTKDSVYWVNQIRELIPYRPEKRFSDAIKGLFCYGAKRVQTTHQHLLVTGGTPAEPASLFNVPNAPTG